MKLENTTEKIKKLNSAFPLIKIRKKCLGLKPKQ